MHFIFAITSYNNKYYKIIQNLIKNYHNCLTFNIWQSIYHSLNKIKSVHRTHSKFTHHDRQFYSMLRVINTFSSYRSKTIFNISVKFNEYSRTYKIRRESGKQKHEIIQEPPIRISIVTEFLYTLHRGELSKDSFK